MTENLIIKEIIRTIVILWGIVNIFCLGGFWNNKKSIDDDSIRAIQLVAINSIFIVLMFIYFVVTVIIL